MKQQEFCTIQGGLDGLGSIHGQCGEGYFRIALTHSAERLGEAMTRMARFPD